MRVCAIAILGDFVVIEREERVLKAFSGKNVCGRGPCYRSPPGNCTWRWYGNRWRRSESNVNNLAKIEWEEVQI